MKYRIRGYLKGKGEAFCCQTLNHITGQNDIAFMMNRYPSGLTVKLEREDRKERTGWKLLSQRTN